jgi:hypothetical protein
MGRGAQRQRGWTTPILLVVALWLAGCGGGGDKSAAKPSADEGISTTDVTTTTSPIDLAELTLSSGEMGMLYPGVQGATASDLDFQKAPRIDWCGSIADVAAMAPEDLVGGNYRSADSRGLYFEVGRFDDASAVVAAAKPPDGCTTGTFRAIGGSSNPIAVTASPLPSVMGDLPSGTVMTGFQIADGSGGGAEATFTAGGAVVRVQVIATDPARAVFDATDLVGRLSSRIEAKTATEGATGG